MIPGQSDAMKAVKDTDIYALIRKAAMIEAKKKPEEQTPFLFGQLPKQ